MKAAVALQMKASNWKAYSKNTLVGFVDLEICDIGLLIRGVCLHQKNGTRWVSMPAKPWTDKEGTQQWQAIVEFTDSDAREAFQEAALKAIDQMVRTR